ncbi:SEP-domain-containing protein [Meredithblackwellia eburnea MCA 4105]
MASEADLAQFTSITGASVEQATFFLESSGGNLDAAVSAFFESGGNATPASGGSIGGTAGGGDLMDDEDDLEDDEEEAPQPTYASPAPAASSWGGGRTLSGAAAPASAAPAFGSSSNSSSRSGTPTNPFRSSAAPRVSTLRDLAPSGPPAHSGSGPRIGRLPQGDDDDDDDDDERDPANFFAGGEKSGLSVQNPNAKKGGGTSDMIKGILQKAKEGGTRIAGEAAQAAQPRSAFSGGGHTLGSDETPSTFIPDPNARASRQRHPGAFPGAAGADDEDDLKEEEEETVIKYLTFWKDGFSIDDGDLMRYEENKEVLAAINSGRAPLSLLKVRHDQPVELRIARRMDEEWVRQPSAPAGPFSGSGNRLGSIDTPPVASSRPAAPSSAPAADRPALGTVFEVDTTQPTTQLQIRLRDGSRMVGRFNHTHTVGDVRRYINSANPGQAATNYVLQTTFPSRDLTDDAATLKDANLLGSVIVQRGI